MLEKVSYRGTLVSDHKALDGRKTVGELQSRGVEFASDVIEFLSGYVAQFDDPDGNGDR